MAKLETYVCRKCNTKNPLPRNAYQSVSCFDCGTKHAIVTDNQKKYVLPYFQQERATPAANTETTE